MTAFPKSLRSPDHKPALAWFCLTAMLWTVCLLYAGGFTTSIEAGMAFLDWPLSNGSINPDGWLTESDKMAEHSHRLLGAIVGFLTVIIAIWMWVREERLWLRKLAWGAVALVIFQGLLGGFRVMLDNLNTGTESNVAAQTFRVLHGCTAQIFVCTLVALAVASTKTWIHGGAGLQRTVSSKTQVAGWATLGAIFIQLVLGALMRHNNAGLAIPTFPLTPEGGLVPEYWSAGVALHFAHRAWAVVVTVALLWYAGRLWSARYAGRILGAGSIALVLLLSIQVYLGALTVWTLRNPHAATLHMLTGAALLATCWTLVLVTHRGRFSESPAAAPNGIAEATNVIATS